MTNPRGTSSGTNTQTPYFTESSTGEVTASNRMPIAKDVGTVVVPATGTLLTSGVVGTVGVNAAVGGTLLTTTTSASNSGDTEQYTRSEHNVIVKTYAVKRG